MDAISIGEIEPYFIDYEKKATLQLLTNEQYIQKIQYNQNTPFPMLLFPRDFFILGLDQTIGQINGKEISQVHFVNFYSLDYPENLETIKYRFSVKWDDFIKVLNNHSDKLYYTNSIGSWWRGNIFLTHSNYTIDHCTACLFIKLSKSLPEFKAEDYRHPRVYYNLDTYKNEELIGGYPLDFFLIENYNKGQYEISKVLAEEIPDWFIYGNGNRFAFDWNQFLKISKDSLWRNNSEAYTLIDAFKLQRFKYSDSILTISKKGKFLKGGKDLLCRKELTNSFYIKTTKSFENFYTDGLEGIFLGDPLNEHLHRPGHSIVELAMKYVLSGKISAFQNDSLLTPMTIEEFYTNASELVDAKEFHFTERYNKEDTVVIQNKYFILTEGIQPDLIKDYASLMKIVEPFTPALYDPQKLIPLHLIQKITFDKEGNKKNYELQGIGLNIPNNINYKGIEIPIGYIKWEELKRELLSDAEAIINYKDRRVNLVELIESRQFFSALYKTGFLQSVE